MSSVSFPRQVIAIGVWAVAIAGVGRAQQPTADQARRLLESQPALVAQLRQELANSGLTIDQIHARLRAAGYPETLLDAYLGANGREGARQADRDLSGAGLVPSDDVLDAVAALGITDSVDTSALRALLANRRMQGLRGGRDTAARRGDSMPLMPGQRLDRLGFVDSVAVADSLALVDSLGFDAMTDSLGRPSAIVARRGRSLGLGRRVTRVDSGFTVFGTSVFQGATTQFDPNLAGPVDASYRLGAGDRIVLIITGDAERAYTLDVTREGFIVVPGVGEVPVANLTVGDLEQVLYQRLARVYSGIRRGADATTHFSLNVARLHTNQVFVLGDVEQPGSYRISSAGTVLSALYAAGGPSATGSMRRVEIRRGGRVADTLDLYDYLLRADASRDLRLQSGDVVFVPVHGPRVRVYGEVVRPGTYELRSGETLADVLRAAGGFTAEASRRRVQIARILAPTARDTTDRARVLLDVTSDEFATGTGPRYPVEPGDVVRVFPVSERVTRRLMVRGDVWSPGAVGFTTGMRLSDAIRVAGGLKPDAYLGQVLVSRLRRADSVRVQLRSAFRDSTGRPTDDLALDEDDDIRVFSMAELHSLEYVAITGAVRRPGRFAYREGMTLRDLILLAGGLDDRAYLREAEVARRSGSTDRGGAGAASGRLAVSQRVALDSTYVIARNGVELGPVRQAGDADGHEGGHTTTEFALQPYDNVLIFAKPELASTPERLSADGRAKHVAVDGEVRFPGRYTLLSTDERLGDVLRRSGGLTPEAQPDGIVFYRRKNGVGRIDVDLPRVLADSSYSGNLLVEDGDSIHVPRVSSVVEVQGAVNAPRAVSYVPGANLDYYVRAAGGPTRTAATGQAYVTQPDGRIESVRSRRLWFASVPAPRAGSTVYVPDGEKQQPTDPFNRLAAVGQLVAGIVALVAVIRH